LLLNQLCTAKELLPVVVDVGPVTESRSQLSGDAGEPTTSSHPAVAVAHQRTRVSVEE
jgi:hypothetical protein